MPQLRPFLLLSVLYMVFTLCLLLMQYGLLTHQAHATTSNLTFGASGQAVVYNYAGGCGH